MSQIKLRPYQQKFIDDIRNEFRLGYRRVVGVAPCGAGKTIMTGWMIRQAAWKGKRSIFFVHRHELIEQTAKTFTALDIPHGIIAAGCDMNLNLPVQIASVQTLVRRLKDIPAPDFLICDECHHILAKSYKKIINTFSDAYLLGVTATPLRRGGVTLCDVFQSMVESLSVPELIKLGNLTPIEYFAPRFSADLSKVHTVCGDYVNSELERALRNPIIIGNVVDHYRQFADGKSAICYCVNVNHSRVVAQAFKDKGIVAAAVDGNTPADERARLVDDFRQGKINVLCNAELFGEGFDVPNCHAVILARPTKSLTLFIQQAMRSMRPDPNEPNKVAVIIDTVNNYQRHGYPDDFRSWSLDPNAPKREGEPPYKICPDCDKRNPVGKRFCTCGHKFPLVRVQEELNEDENPIVQHVTQNVKAPANAPKIKRAFTKPEEFLEIAEERKYKIGWVALQSLKYAQSYDDCLVIANTCGYNQGWARHRWLELSENRSVQTKTPLR